MKNDELLIAQIEDKIRQADEWSMMTAGDFLDAHQRKILTDYVRGRKLPIRMALYGGYADAERCMPVFLPEYMEWDGGFEAIPEEVGALLQVIRVSVPKGGKALTHRDYLGSLLALGLDREVTGDILVRGEDAPAGLGADIIVKAEIAEFIEMHYEKAGRANLTVSVHPIEELMTGESHIIKKQDTVASLRLDSVAASAFALSRAKASDAIRRGIVSVNSVEALKTDMEVKEGDKIVLRGRGKAVLAEVGGTSRKDRIRITLDPYR